MGQRIHLVGRPRIERDGRAQPGPRGAKAWALLTYLVLCPHPPARSHLAELLFPEAEDPLGALRWNLSELRRALGQPHALRGDPVRLELDADTSVDVLSLISATPETLAGMTPAEGELLESQNTALSPAFEVWLLAERRRLGAMIEAALREQVLLRLAADDALEAARLAARLVAANPLEEGHHELFLRSLLSAGDRPAANAHLEACAELFRRELGAEPSGRLARLLRAPSEWGMQLPQGGVAAARAQLEAGEAALAAGASEPGIEMLRCAAHAAEAAGDVVLRLRVLLALGGALVHTMRGHEEAATVLHKAADLAVRAGEPVMAATAYREIGFIDVQAGRRQRARVWLDRAEAAADTHPDELASIHAVRGMDFSDAGDYAKAEDSLMQSLEHAGTRAQRQTALSCSLLGRVHVLTGRYAQAREHLQRAVRAVERTRWLAFQPWPEALLAEADIEERRLEPARERLEHAFAMACQLGDPCWEGVTARGLGRVEAGRGGRELALAWLKDARKRCLRPASPYQWVHGWILDGLAEVSGAESQAEGLRWARALESVATRGAMREFVVRACLHRHRLGEDRALHAARLLVADIDNPHLRGSVR